MSLNRGVAALGAVAVVGAATLGIALPIAAHYAPPKPMVAVTAGSTWMQFAPLCWNKGDALTAKQIATCGNDVKNAATDTKSGNTIEVAPNATFMINTTEDIASKGWSAQAGQSELVARTTNQQAGNLSASAVLQAAQASTAPVVVIESDDSGKQIFGVWTFVVKQQGS